MHICSTGLPKLYENLHSMFGHKTKSSDFSSFSNENQNVKDENTIRTDEGATLLGQIFDRFKQILDKFLRK